MKAQLNRGKIDTPSSLADAKLRLQQLDHELIRIRAQLTSKDRVSRYPTQAEYAKWLRSAKVAQGLLSEERAQLADWIANTEGSAEEMLAEAEALLSEALGAFDSMRSDGVAFEPYERAAFEKINDYFAAKNEDAEERRIANDPNA